VLLAEDETVLLGMIDRLIEIGRCYSMEMNVEKTKVTRISRQPTRHNKDRPKTTGEVAETSLYQSLKTFPPYVQISLNC
jgi:hypothetical protein